MAEDNNEHVEAQLNTFIETQEQNTQSLRDELANTRLALEREADAAKEINTSARRVLQATEKHLNDQINK